MNIYIYTYIVVFGGVFMQWLVLLIRNTYTWFLILEMKKKGKKKERKNEMEKKSSDR